VTWKYDRAHGTAAGLYERNAEWTRARPAAFLLPHMSAGMSLLDLGYGPGSITMGFAMMPLFAACDPAA